MGPGESKATAMAVINISGDKQKYPGDGTHDVEGSLEEVTGFSLRYFKLPTTKNERLDRVSRFRQELIEELVGIRSRDRRRTKSLDARFDLPHEPLHPLLIRIRKEQGDQVLAQITENVRLPFAVVKNPQERLDAAELVELPRLDAKENNRQGCLGAIGPEFLALHLL